MVKICTTAILLGWVLFIISAISSWFITDLAFVWKVLYTAAVLWPGKFVIKLWWSGITYNDIYIDLES